MIIIFNILKDEDIYDEMSEEKIYIYDEMSERVMHGILEKMYVYVN